MVDINNLNKRIICMFSAIKTSKYKKNILALLFYLVFFVILLFPTLNANKLIVSGDGYMYYLSKVFLKHCIDNHELPFWNPYTSIGYPFLADVQMSVFNPFNVLYFFFDVSLGYNIYRLIQLLLASFFMYLLLKEYRINYLICLGIGLAYAMSTCLGGVRVEHNTIVTTLAYCPCILYWIQRYNNSQLFRYLAFSSFFMALQFLSGFTQIVLYFDISVVIFFLCKKMFYRSNILKTIITVLSWGITYILLVCAQLLPTAVAIANSSKSNPSYDAFKIYAYDLRVILFLIFPNLTQNVYDPYGLYASTGLDNELYFGIIFFAILTAFVFVSVKDGNVVVKKILYIIGLLFIIGLAPTVPILGQILFKVPIINSFRCQGRVIPVIMCYVFLLIGLALQDVITNNRNVYLKVCLMLESILFSGLFLIICIFTQQAEVIHIDRDYIENVYRCLMIAIVLLALAIVGFFIFRKNDNAIVHKIVISGLIAINIIDVSRVSLIYLDKIQDTAFLDSANIDEHTFELMNEDTSNGYRSYVATDNENAFYKEKILNIGKYGRQEVYDLNFYNSWITFIDKKLFYWGMQEIVHYPILNYKIHDETQIISMLSISHIYDAWNHQFDVDNASIEKEYSVVYDDKQLESYKNMEANKIISIPQEVKQIDYYTDSYLSDGLVDVDKNAYVLSTDSGSHVLKKNGNSEISNILWKKNTVTCDVNSDEETFIVHSQLFYPGWRVYVDGREYKLYCVNNLLQGVYVPSGSHQVVFSYRPRYLRLGIVLSCIGIFVFVLQIAFNNSILLLVLEKYFRKGRNETKTVSGSSVL